MMVRVALWMGSRGRGTNLIADYPYLASRFRVRWNDSDRSEVQGVYDLRLACRLCRLSEAKTHLAGILRKEGKCCAGLGSETTYTRENMCTAQIWPRIATGVETH